ncbi:restriction endonuclease subunit S [Methylocapsa acidiphila]|uniref:restriction endonuclease subunit S n=1 Tax=Methylocapsa acidiphila TaxID=133552 RepID=UPI0018DCBF4B|nr:restriction endonuclease subunit S [Methylocapsa acidiphila]
MRPNLRRYLLAADEDANLVGMRLYGAGPFHRELKPAMAIMKKSHFVIREGDVIYNKLFAWKGTFGIVPPELDGMFVSDKFPTYELDRARVSEKYLTWFFRHPNVWEQARVMSTGSAALSKLTLNPPRFLDLAIPLPDLSEQQRIAERIEELATKIGSARDVRSKSTSESESLLSAACESMLLRAGTSAPIRKLSSLVDPDRGISYGIVQTGTEFEGGIPTLRAGDLQWFHVNTSGVKLVDPEIERGYLRTRLQGGELLLRIRGGVGELAVCPESMAGGNVSREIAVIPLTDEVLPRFAMFLLSARSSQAKMHGNVRGTSYLGINLKDVRELEIPVPTVSKQQEMLSDLESLKGKLDTLAKLQNETAAELDAMLPAILDKAFKGEL